MASPDPRAVLTAWHRAAAALLPAGTRVWDAHTHTGDQDPDGVTNSAPDLVTALDEAGHKAAVVCTSADPGGYREPNDRVLDESSEHRGRLIPFLRVDPNRSTAVNEVERCLDLGHRGVKLHPRSERFTLADPGVHAIAGLAADRGAPLLVHAGRGIPPLARDALDLVAAHPRLVVILAHCAISDLPVIAAAGHERVFIDTAWWNPVEHLALFGWVDAARIVYASDTPYGHPVLGSIVATRVAAQAGLGGAALAAVLGGNLRRVLGESGLDEHHGTGLAAAPDLGLQRVAGYLFGAVADLRGGRPPGEAHELARRAADRSGGPHERVHAAIAATLDAMPTAPDGSRSAFALTVVALTAAYTPDVAVPDLAAVAGETPP